MNRRRFLKKSSATLALSPWLNGQAVQPVIDLKNCTVVVSKSATAREKKAAVVLVEEVEKRSGLRWPIQSELPPSSSGVILSVTPSSQAAEGYRIRTNGNSISIIGADERGLLFGIGRLLRIMVFERQSAILQALETDIVTSPKYQLRGHQLGYRPKTNSYDAWTVATWDQYIRDLALFGTNAIELLPPHTDDLPDSPHFPLPPEQMMIQMSRIADDYGLDVWVWYPASDSDKEWEHICEMLPRIDAIFVPGGDPGDTAPGPLLALLEKRKMSLRRFHPKARMWVSPQGFNEEWLKDFFGILDQEHTATWLDGIVYGPQNRMSLPEIRERLPKHYPIRLYPDITHSLECQYPVPDWDVGYALTEGRECINPRPEDQANIFRRSAPHSIGFLAYSEGCNDDVNKFVWSALGWDPAIRVVDALRDFGRYFLGRSEAEGFAQGLLQLEKNWRGPLATNTGVAVTLARFQDLERSASPAVLGNWRFQQALYRAYYDASVRSRLIEETARLQRALNILGRINEIGWTSEPLEIGRPPSPRPPNGLDPALLLDQAERILNEPGSDLLLNRVRELGEALFQSIQMQLAVNRYQGEAVDRAANLETLEYPVTDAPWLRAQIALLRKLTGWDQQVNAIKQLLTRTDPGPGGFYDELGDPSNRPHLVPGAGSFDDPEFRSSALTGFRYPDTFGSDAPIAWKRWAESLFDAPLRMRYTDLDSAAQYRIRVVYSGDSRHTKMRLVANQKYEIHPLLTRPWPPKPQDFDIPLEATSGGRLDLAWTREQGLGGNGRGCQVSEVWLIKK